MTPFVFYIKEGLFENADLKISFAAYSGAPGHVNDASDPTEQLKNQDPLPPGPYVIGYPIEHPILGPLSMPLTPMPVHQPSCPINSCPKCKCACQPYAWLMGRGSFYIHGDNIKRNESGSEGCIVPLAGSTARRQIAALLTKTRQLTVKLQKDPQ